MRSVGTWAVAGVLAASLAWVQPARAHDCGCHGQGKAQGGSGSQERRTGTGGGPVAREGEACCGCTCTKDGQPSENCGCTCMQDGQRLPPCPRPPQGQGGSGMRRDIPDRVPSTVPQAPEDRGGSAVTPGASGR
jgi:hypothetical protein